MVQRERSCLGRAGRIAALVILLATAALLTSVFLSSGRADRRFGDFVRERYPDFEVMSVSAHNRDSVSYVLRHERRPEMWILVRLFRLQDEGEIGYYPPPYDEVFDGWFTNETYIASLSESELDAFVDAYVTLCSRSDLLINVQSHPGDGGEVLDVYLHQGRSAGEAAHSTLNANRRALWRWDGLRWTQESIEDGHWL